ncbi:thiamine pyrophosphate-dependent enzyme [Leifsonia sp. NPDC058194]|uniref:thiamine pyrophosphate-dependent enzyme n=1 Tax=Leifsonia sp. NPDC058194 TaxID=3346374 RepID=UPI0036D86541
MPLTTLETVTVAPVGLPALLRRLYRTMATVRRIDAGARALERRGELPGHRSVAGNEAVQVGSAAALDPARDLAFPAARDLGVAVTTSADAALAVHSRAARAVGGSPVAHAVAWALGAKLDRTGGVALVLLGPGITAREVDEAMTTAAVSHLPVVFVGPAAPSRVQGMPTTLVDGVDALAVHDATARALDRARTGGGPSVVEPVLPEPGAWGGRDPLLVCEQLLRETGTVDDGFFADVADTTDALAAAVLGRIRTGRA